MRQSYFGRFRWELGLLRRQFLQDGSLPFADVLSAALVARALVAVGTAWYDRIYTPMVTCGCSWATPTRFFATRSHGSSCTTQSVSRGRGSPSGRGGQPCKGGKKR